MHLINIMVPFGYILWKGDNNLCTKKKVKYFEWNKITLLTKNKKFAVKYKF